MDDKGASGTITGSFKDDSSAAVAHMLGGTSSLLEVRIKAVGLPDKDLWR